jgi:hypothetical protein
MIHQIGRCRSDAFCPQLEQKGPLSAVPQLAHDGSTVMNDFPLPQFEHPAVQQAIPSGRLG